ncbi:3'-5' DNA helicase [Toensbergia leucococca]|nr:3'-5' DNA helicase [Toensbergia leucococca]
MVNSNSDDEFGTFDDEDLVFAVSRVESTSPEIPVYRATKRQRISQSDEVDHVAFNPAIAQASSQSAVLEADIDATFPLPKPKSKYRIHVPKRSEVPQDTFHTQVPQTQGSPHRISGPRWQRPTARLSSPTSAGSGLHGQTPTAASNTRVVKRPQVEDSNPAESPVPVNKVRGSHFEDVQISFGDTESRLRRQALRSRDEESFSPGPADILADLPSDAFSSPAQAARGSLDQPIHASSQQADAYDKFFGETQRNHTVGLQKNLRQTTLFGERAPETNSQSQAQSTRHHNWPLANREEPSTHHKLNTDALKTWVYPTNLGTIRDYQYSIVARGLYHNLLVALPTGLGKTFIAATIMLNWFRWTVDAQIAFVAPTKPLVAQQVKACFDIAGIPRSTTTMLTGGTAPGLRAEEWMSKRVFFMTPQTIINDLKSGICDPKRLVLLVVDEAHRATGGYAYVEIVRFLRRFNSSFRVLALTATPGASVESVQEVIDGLEISRVEIRTEESIDIRQYVHSRKIETVLFDYTDEMVMVMDLYAKALQPCLDKLNGMNAYWTKDPMALSTYGCNQARQKWMSSDAGRKASFPVKGMVNTIFTLLASLAHGIELLKFHGIGPFYHKVLDFRNELKCAEKTSKYSKQINESEEFCTMMTRLQGWMHNPDFVGHPKLEYLRSVVLNHFLDAGDGRGAANPSGTRIMVFVHYRASAEEVARVLKRNEPMIRPHVFVGQANSKGSDGMDQKAQLSVVQKFKDGIYNTLVATSIGEEGLDIGEVDLIVCYDASASPIRMLQRMGRTGRKRAGNIVVMLMRGKEENNFIKAKDNYEKMQQEISAGTRFNFHDEQSRRIVPKDILPVVDKRVIEIPLENTQPDLPEPKRRGKAPKKPPKKFHMPDGVRTGFVRASKVGDEDDDSGSGDDNLLSNLRSLPSRSLTPESIPTLDEVLLTASEEKELERSYLDVGGDTPQIVEVPRFDAFPEVQRVLRKTKHVGHGRTTRSTVNMLNIIHNVTSSGTERYLKNLHKNDRKIADAQAEKRASFFRGSPGNSHLSKSPSPNALKPRSPLNGKKHSDPCVSGVRTTSCVDLSSSESGDESVDDQGDLLDDDLEEDEGFPLHKSSPPPLVQASKPFYQSQDKLYDTKSNSEDDLPAFDTLVKRPGSVTARALAGTTKANVLPRLSQRKPRKRIVEDDSDD